MEREGNNVDRINNRKDKNRIKKIIEKDENKYT